MLAGILLVSTAQQVRASTASVWTGQDDYAWNSTVTIYGSGFIAVGTVNVNVTDPNGAVVAWTVTSDVTGSFTTTYQLGSVAGYYVVGANDGTNDATWIFHDAAQSANIDQCTNGPVAKGVITPEPCLVGTVLGGNLTGTSFSNWVNGNSNAAKSHWREGEFIAYRATLAGLSAGTHRLVIQYDTVHGGKHAIDYLGSFDATETTALASTQFHYNFNNPCVDILGSTICPQAAPPTPLNSVPVPPASLINCAGSAGGPITQVAGSFKLFGAGGSIVDVNYPEQNVVSGTGQCSSQAAVNITVPSGVSTVVLTWGGHIASQADWGFGNSASAISGSPYHMALVSLDGASVGSQDRALATSAIFFTPTIVTTIYDASTKLPVPGTPPTAIVGTTVYDNSTISSTSPIAGGTVYYAFFNNIGCTGAPATNQSVSVSGASVPNSPNHGPLAAGSYSFQAYYTGDNNNNVLPAKSTCEPLVIGQGTSSTATHIYAVGTTSPDLQGSTQALGTNVYDTAIVTATPLTPTGTVTYTFYNGGSCSGTVISTKTVTLSGGSVPNSDATGALAAGSYSFEAVYSGDLNYAGSTSPCEPLTIAKGTSTTATHIYAVGTTSPDLQGSTQALGADVYDTAIVTATPFTPTGTVTYSFFSGGCGGTLLSTKTVTLSGGNVPNSDATGALAAGSYAFQAVYSGDSNYAGSTSACEPLTIAKASSSTATHIYVAGTTSPDVQGSSQPLGTSVYDTAIVTATPFTPTGTVTYTFFSGSCTGTVLSTKTVTLASGLVPNSDVTGALAAGNYAFQAVYSGDSNYGGSTSPCETLTIAKATTTTATALFVTGTTGPDVQGSSQPLGTSVYDTATVTASPFTPTGTVVYTFYSGTCGGSVISTQTVTLSGGLVPASLDTGALTAGNYAFQAVYSGDSNYGGSTSPCETLTIAKATTTTATALFAVGTTSPDLQGSTQALGTNVYDTATVSGSPFTPTGTVIYTFFSGGCGGSVISTQTVTMSGGAVPASSATGALTAGSYAFQAVYSGDSNYGGSTSPCETLTIAKASTTTSTAIFVVGTTGPDVQGTTQPLGTNVYDTATVSASPFTATGTVTYTFFSGTCGGTIISTQTVTLSGGLVPASAATGALTAGSYGFQAVYSGDSNYGGSTSPCEPLTIAKASTTTATAIFVAGTTGPDVQGTTQPLGTSVYDTATVSASPFTATGTVTYTFFSGTCGGSVISTQTVTLSGGLVPASAATGALMAGSYGFQAVYSGDSNYGGSTSPCEPLTIAKASTSTATAIFVTGTTGPDVQGSTQPLGTSVFDTATVSASPFTATGTVVYTFFSGTCGGSVISTQTVTLAGGLVPASADTGALVAGSYGFQAVYSGDSNYGGSTSPCESLTIAQASTSTSTEIFVVGTTGPDVQGTTQPLGTNVYDTATVAASPFTATGTVTYNFYGGTCGGTLLSTQTVTLVGGAVPNSAATGLLTAGSYGFQAVYSGDSNYGGSTSLCETLTIAKASTSTATEIFVTGTSGPDVQGTTQPLGTSVYDTATVSASPFVATGTVMYTFYKGTCGGTVLFTDTVSLTGGLAPSSVPTGQLMAGTYAFDAVYSGDSNYGGSTSPCEPLTIAKADTSAATQMFVAGTTGPDVQGTTQPLGTSVYDTATVSASPFTATGTVTYTFFSGTCGGSVLGTQTVTLSGGLVPASAATVPLQAGSYAFQAAYSGDSNYNPSTSPCEPLTIAQAQSSTATAIFVAGTTGPDVQGSTQPLGTSVYDTAIVSASPFTATGTVVYTFFSGTCGGSVISTKTVTLVAGLVPSSDVTGMLEAGSYAFQAVYSGDSNYIGSTSPCEPLTIAQAGTSTATQIFAAGTTGPDIQGTTQPLGTSVYDTATVSASPFTATGTVTYTFYNSACGGTVISTKTVNLAGGLVPNSDVTGALMAGSYAFQAVYSGDSNYIGSTSPCEPLTIAQASTTTATAIFVSGTTGPDVQGSSQPLGTSVFDTATVSASPFTATGTVVYTFFSGTCGGSVISTQTVTLAGGLVPASADTGALMAGSYGFEAVYSGDSNYIGSTSPCEPLTIAKAETSTATAIFVTGTTGPDVQGTSQPLGTSVYDTATVSASPFTATGTVTYTFFGGSCGGSVISTKTVNLVNGLVPNSDATASLAAGTYGFVAVYSGDSNYFGSTSPCEPLTIAKASTTTATQIFLAGTTGPDIQGSTQPLGTSVYDTATVSASPFTATGTVTYTFFSGTCGGTVLSTKTVTLVGGAVPSSDLTGALEAGTYGFQAVYSGDSNYLGSTSGCEPLTIAQASTTSATEIFAAGTTGPDLQNTEQPLGTSIFDTATVTASPFTPTGSVTYTFFSGTCGGTAISTQTVALVAGLVPDSSATGYLHAGTYAFQAVYSGDSNYIGSTSPCEPITILPQLEVIKVVNNGSPPAGILEQPPGPDGFTMSVTGTGVSTSFPGSTSGTTMDIGLGAFSVSESPYNTPIPLGHFINVTYSTTVTGDCSGLNQPFTGTITLAKDLFVCTVTNTAVYTESPNAQLIIIKNAVGGDGTFTYTVSGPSVPSIYPANPSITTVGGTGQFPASTLLIDHGDYSISENSQAGWTLKSITCSVNGGAPITETNGFTINVDFGSTVVCTFTNIKPSTSQVTDTSFCPFDVDSGLAGNQFRVILIPDPTSPSTYRMTATNPGQFYYNVFYVGVPGSAVNLQIGIPWPFVTQGAQPVHVYNATGTNSAGCLLQIGDVSSSFTMKGPSTTSSGGPQIQLSDYASQANGQTQTITVTGSEPSTGLAYVTIHVMWGIKGSAGWTKTSSGCLLGSSPKSCIGDAANATLTIPNDFAYTFSFTETNTATSGTAAAYNENVFKNDPGIAGVITDSHGTPVVGAKVVIVGGGNTWTLYTDTDGFYQLVYKYTGKPTTFTVTATFGTHAASGSVTLKSNTFVVVNLVFADL